MTAVFLQSGPMISTGQQGRDWVAVGSDDNRNLTSGMSQNKLLFNEAIPASPFNRATHVRPPAPIVIERLLPVPESRERERADSARSSVSFTSLSEEKLQAAVQLAKRDLRRRRLASLANSPVNPSQQASVLETSDVELLQELAATPNKAKLTASSPKEKLSGPSGRLSVNASQKFPISPISIPCAGLSPPTRDPGMRHLEAGKQGPLSQEIHKLQNELEVYIWKVEELANRGEKIEEPLEPEEQDRLEIRRQKQAARSARGVYVLQQQVKEIKEDIEKLRIQKMWDAKKPLAINRLAAAHRGALRALQVFIQQLSDVSQPKVPPYYKQLGQLIRQLSLCSARVEAVPEMGIDILQKLETLDNALSKHQTHEKLQALARPARRRSPHRSVSPPGAPKGPSKPTVRGPCKPTNPKRGTHASKRTVPQKPRTALNRREVLRAGLESLTQQREPRELRGKARTNKKGGAPLSPRSKADVVTKRNQSQDAGFRQPTVSSQLRVNQIPQKELTVPWIPTSPHSPPPQRSPQRTRPEPRCLFSPIRPPPGSPQQRGPAGSGARSPEKKKKHAQDEALREAWLDKMTTQRLKELNQLSKEEATRIQRLRSEVVSPTVWAERAEQEARDRIQPLLDEAQIGKSRPRISLRDRLSEQPAETAADSAERLGEALSGDLLQDMARAAWAAQVDRQAEGEALAAWEARADRQAEEGEAPVARVAWADRQAEGEARRMLQAPTVESMLLRMDEIQRDQEEVRRRFASITYSDPLHWEERPAAAAGPQCGASGSGPASPQPIRLTRPVLRQSPAADIVLQKPVETGHSILSENSVVEEEVASGDQQRHGTAFPGPAARGGGGATLLSVPASMLGNIRRYREDHEAYLRVVAHEAVGSFNPWAIADSLADELLSEALADVAAEFQDVVEEYAEAVFTSEFLQPIQSPPVALVGQ